MQIDETFIKNLQIFSPKIFYDERGYFFESFNKKLFNELGFKDEFVQDNESYSKFGILRGLHFQDKKYAQSKLIRVVKGRILDVAVDLRKDSPTFGQYFSIELSEHNKKQLFLPRGLAHGFVTLSEEAIIQYKCDNYYNKEAERGIVFNDPELNINWQLNTNDIIVNDRDKNFQTFADYKQNFLSGD